MSIDTVNLTSRFGDVMGAATPERRNQIASIMNHSGWPKEMGEPIPIGKDRGNACTLLYRIAKEALPDHLLYHQDCLRRGVSSDTLKPKDEWPGIIDHRTPGDPALQTSENGGHDYEQGFNPNDTPSVETIWNCLNYCGCAMGVKTYWAPESVDPFGKCPGPVLD